MNKEFLRAIRPLLIVFIALTAFFITGKNWLLSQGLNNEVLIIGNLIIFFSTIAAVWVLLKGGHSGNAQSFVRAMYGSFMIRFFVILAAAFFYMILAKKNLNKPGLVACLFIYALYSFIEISQLLKMLKRKKNA